MSEETQDILLDHSSNPRNTKPLNEKCTHSAAAENPSCGDELSLEFILSDGRVSAVSISPKGCAVSKATASIFSQYILGKELSEIEAAGSLLSEGLKTGAFSEELAELQALRSLSDFPMRHRCVLLPFEAFSKANS